MTRHREPDPAESDLPTLPDSDSPGARTGPIGPYRPLRKIGAGGMGEVWLADQTGPIRRKVALKIVKRGLDTEAVVARFEVERQALAMMDHPCVAKVFEAGSTPDGRPYFVMEFVPGEALTAYCDKNKLNIVERLKLFQQACEGVQHAHQKGIIHRDLKPSNVLVTSQHGRPRVKVIDFGLAKAMQQRLTERTFFTEVGTFVGTPEYMSPEQADAKGLDVDTRTDVYALGVVLYELLAGALPFDPGYLRQAGLEAIRRTIREVEPSRPSERVSTLGARSAEIARGRGTDPSRLADCLRGDLDWITMKALEKDRTRRYGSPSDLAADIARYLAHKPILAHPPSFGYQAAKFLRRHRIPVLAASFALLSLVVFAAAMAWQAQRVAMERNRAEWVSEFLISLFLASDPSQNPGETLTARDLLDRGAQRIDRELKDDPALQARVMAMLGRTYEGLGLNDRAESLLTEAVRLQRRHLGPDHRDTISSVHNLAIVNWNLGRYPEAEELYREAIARGRRALGPKAPQTLNSMANLATVFSSQGRYAEAESLASETLELRREAQGPRHLETLSSMMDLALIYDKQGRWTEAEALLKESLNVKREVLGAEHPETLKAEYNLALIINRLGRYAEADPIFAETVQGMTKVFGEEHPFTLTGMSGLAMNTANQGRYTEAEKLHRRVLELQTRVLGANHPATIASIYNLGCLEALQGNRARALQWLRKAVEAGYFESEWMQRDPDLKSLQGDPEFRSLVEQAGDATVSRNPSPPAR